jgi:L-amino acid N-acyltransferase YncA
LIVRVASPASLAWLAHATGLAVNGDFQAIEAVDSAGQIHGVVGYDKWTHSSVRMHVAVAHYASMELIKKAFWYAFVFAKKQVAIGEVAESNRKSRKLAVKLGFKELARIPDGSAPNDATIIYTLRSENCRWIKEAQNEHQRQRA